MTVIFTGFGTMINTGLLRLSSSYDCYMYIYNGVALVLLAYIILVFFGMKDVIKSTDFVLRRTRTDTDTSQQKRAGHVFKQALILMCSEPQILFGILGQNIAKLIF